SRAGTLLPLLRGVAAFSTTDAGQPPLQGVHLLGSVTARHLGEVRDHREILSVLRQLAQRQLTLAPPQQLLRSGAPRPPVPTEHLDHLLVALPIPAAAHERLGRI